MPKPKAKPARRVTKVAKPKKAREGKQAPARKTAAPKTSKVKLLSGGNPRIAKGDGDAPVQAYIAAMPGWKQAVGGKIDQVITRAVPGVKKAIKWNSPFYGMEGQGWFIGFHCLTKYVKVAFLRGVHLTPVPPVASKQKEPRYLDIFEGDQLDEAQLADWALQASKLPGWKL